MLNRAHIVGAGLSGLAAAHSLSQSGYAIRLYESGPQAGGRCRSYFDKSLGCTVDNGNHLLLSGNHAAMQFLAEVGSRNALTGPGKPEFPFRDLATGETWTVRPNLGRIPWWVLARARKVPGAHLSEFLPLLSLHKAPPEATVADCLKQGELARRLLEPLAIAALNTMPEAGSARLLGTVVRETLAQGGAACIPLWPREGLSAAFIDPALAYLRAKGAEILFSYRVSSLTIEAAQVTGLEGPEGPIQIGQGDLVILAVSPTIAATLLPGLTVPDAFKSILNLHYRHEAPSGFVGLIGGTAEWVFAKPGHVSVTISAGNRLVEEDPEQLASRVWPEVRAALTLGELPLPAWRVVKEKRATFAATPAQNARRPGPDAGFSNLALAGDFTATGLPATIEGAIRSGRTAAKHLLATRRSLHAA